MTRVSSYFPVSWRNIPECVPGVTLRFRVSYRSGIDRDYFGQFGDMSLLNRTLMDRVRTDVFITNVCVYLPSGRFLCEVDKYS